jgi:polar amino acid transport system permease protein
MIADGEMERILRTWKLWDHRQGEPVEAIATSTTRRPRSFDINQWRLFAEAAVVTLGLSVGAFLLAVPLGMLLAVGRIYGGPIARTLARIYIEVFRGTPVLLQLYVFYYGLAPYYSLGPIQAAILGLGLNYAAYEAEVYRGALLAVPRGQTEAAKALGIHAIPTFLRVILPQALMVALRPYGNEIILMVKGSAIVSIVTVFDLMGETKYAYSRTFDFQIYLWAAILYLAVVELLRNVWNALEKRLTRHLKR